jgi:hypothetical protein
MWTLQKKKPAILPRNLHVTPRFPFDCALLADLERGIPTPA